MSGPDSSYDFGVWKGSVSSTLDSIREEIEGLRDDFKSHEKTDTAVFQKVNENLVDLKVSQAKWGTGLVIAIAVLGWIIPPIIKKLIGAE